MKIVLVTGGNRDIGYEACRQLTAREVEVVLSARSEQAGKVAVEKLSTERQKSVSIRSMSQVAANFFSQKHQLNIQPTTSESKEQESCLDGHHAV